MRHNQTSCTGDTRVHCTYPWPSDSPVNPVDYKIWGEMQQRVHQTMTWMLVHGLDELKQRLIEVWQCLGQNIIDDAIDEWRKCLCACIHVKVEHFEHLPRHPRTRI